MANQTSLGWRREQVAAADLARQAQQIQSVARESQVETRRLASAIDTLNGDRDRLYSRITVLEQGLDSVTGAIARQNFRGPPGSDAGGQRQDSYNPFCNRSRDAPRNRTFGNRAFADRALNRGVLDTGSRSASAAESAGHSSRGSPRSDHRSNPPAREAASCRAD